MQKYLHKSQDIATGWTVVKEAIPNSASGVDTKCPSTHKVTGCGMTNYNNGHGNYENINKYIHYQMVQVVIVMIILVVIVATCLSSVNNSRVYQNSGTNTITVGCEGEPIVFGCGIQLKFRKWHLGKYPQFWANNYNSCADIHIFHLIYMPFVVH